MATWHQRRSARPLYHATQWSVVTDPPHACTSIMTFDTEAAARQCVQRWGNPPHTYILPPHA